MKPISKSICLLLALISASTALAFDCKKASTIAEKSICQSPEALKQDQELNQVFSAALKNLTAKPDEAANLKEQQKFWLQQRDQACQKNAKCFVDAYKYRISSLQSPGTKITTGLSYRKVKFLIPGAKADTPAKIDFEFPEFFGSEAGKVQKINRSVQKIWGKDNRCPEGGDISRSLDVAIATLDVTVLKEHVDAFCEGNAHPANFSQSHTIKNTTGEKLDFWQGLKSEPKNKLLKSVSEFGKNMRNDPNDTDCAEEYDLEKIRHASLDVSFEKGKALITPQFSHARKACEETMEMPINEFAKFYQGQNDLVSAIESLK